MAEEVTYAKFLLRRGKKQDLNNLDPAEPALATDTKELLIGDADGTIEIASQKDLTDIETQTTKNTQDITSIKSSQKSMGDELVDVKTKVDNFDEEIEGLANSISSTNDHVANNSDTISAVSTRVGKTEEDVTGLKTKTTQTDSTLSAVKKEVDDAKGTQTLAAKLNDIGTRFEDNLSYWLPPTQPSTAFGSNGIPTSKDPDNMLNVTYETLRNAHPEYITKVNMGKSTQKSDGTATLYNVYRYEFTPKNYTKTIILSSGTHGNEYTAFFTLWRFMYHLVNDWESHPTLMYIRHNVRLIVTPIINPWGFANNKRQNANLVDLNRNTDYLWQYITSSRYQPGGTNYKGPNPFSENESQYYKQTVDTYSNAIAAIDFHTIVTVGAEHIVYTPKYMSQSREIFEEVIDWLYKPGNRIVDGSAAVPTLYCYAANTHGMTSANPEWYNGLYGGDRGSVEMTECLKYFGNIIIRACRLQQKATYLNQTEPQTTWLMYDRGVTTKPIQLTSTAFANFDHLVYQFPNIRRYGVIKADGTVKVSVSAPCTVTLNPVLYQSYHPDLSWTNTKDADTFAVTRTFAAAGVYDIPIKSFLNAFPTNYNETGAGATQRTAEAKFRLRGKTTAGTVSIEQVKVELTQKSTNVAIPVKYASFTGLEDTPDGTAPTIVYPDPAKYIDDSSEE